MPEKRFLVTPGPTPVPPEVTAAMSQPMLHHRGPEFAAVAERVRGRLREVFRTAGEVILFTASGTSAMEAAVVNVCSPADRVVVASAGHFGERWAAIARAYGLDVVHVRYSWGESLSADEIAASLREAGGARAVYVTHSETSTGVVHDVRAIAERLAGSGALVCVDAVSSLGAVPLETDAWGLDVVVSGSQKALMTPPGLALSTVAPTLWSQPPGSLPRYTLDWRRVAGFGATPAVSLVLGLDAALGMLLDQGLEAAFDRHVRLGRAARAGLKAMGLALFSPDDDRSAVVTAARLPSGIDGRETARAMRDRSGVTVAGGQGELAGRIVRIGHIGHIGIADVVVALEALELALAEAGVVVERGVVSDAALEAYGEPVRA